MSSIGDSRCIASAITCDTPAITRYPLAPICARDQRCFTPIVTTQYHLNPNQGSVISGVGGVCEDTCSHHASCSDVMACGNPNAIPNQVSCPVTWSPCGKYCLTVALPPHRFNMTQQLIRIDLPNNLNETMATSNHYPLLTTSVTLDTKLRVEDIPMTSEINAIQLTPIDLNDVQLIVDGSVETPFVAYDLELRQTLTQQTFELIRPADPLLPIEVNMNVSLSNPGATSVLALSFGNLS